VFWEFRTWVRGKSCFRGSLHDVVLISSSSGGSWCDGVVPLNLLIFKFQYRKY
jgi:hypothetical protein